jgi:hypothetical protein
MVLKNNGLEYDLLNSNPNFDGFESIRLNVIDICGFSFDNGSFGFVLRILGELFLGLIFVE